MSIIYDALKKIENSKTNINDVRPAKKPAENIKRQENPHNSKIKTWLIYLFVICLGLCVGNIFFGKAKTYILPQKIIAPPLPTAVSKQGPATPPSPPVTAKKASSGEMVLNGIFSSGEGNYALINNKIAKVGDVINDAVIKRIDLNGVELDSEGKIIKLSNNE